VTLAAWTVPPSPGESLTERSFSVAGATVRIAAHQDLAAPLDELVARLERDLDHVAPGTEIELPWDGIRFEERDGELRATSQNSRSPLQIPRERRDDVSQLLWVQQAWAAVQDAAGFESDRSGTYRTTVWITPQLLDRTDPVEVRRVHAESDDRWLVGEQPFDERLESDLAGSIKFAANLFKYRPEIIPAMCLPTGWRASVEHESGIREIRDHDGGVVYRA